MKKTVKKYQKYSLLQHGYTTSGVITDTHHRQTTRRRIKKENYRLSSTNLTLL